MWISVTYMWGPKDLRMLCQEKPYQLEPNAQRKDEMKGSQTPKMLQVENRLINYSATNMCFPWRKRMTRRAGHGQSLKPLRLNARLDTWVCPTGFWKCLGLATPLPSHSLHFKGQRLTLLSYACPTTAFWNQKTHFLVPRHGTWPGSFVHLLSTAAFTLPGENWETVAEVTGPKLLTIWPFKKKYSNLCNWVTFTCSANHCEQRSPSTS